MKEIELSKTGRKYKGLYVTCIDDEIFDYLNQWNWSVWIDTIHKTQYAMRKDYSEGRQNGKTIYMHNIICEYFKIEIPEGQTSDHNDGNGLNNQKSNLGPATPSEQSQNRGMRIDNKSGIIGVHWNKQKEKWIVQIQTNNIRTQVGSFDFLEDAKNARNTAVKKYHKDFGVLST
jgi:hypothetical protein